ncbi:MAG: MOSC domain-containing protein [Woeseiaceae bacterium]|nr:MOSC domain-containing protein [Woeseiaceae bacterium]
MRVVSLNIGRAETLSHGNREFYTGICKRPVTGVIHVDELGVGDDIIQDKKNHGGPDQAVYAYSAADYAWWSRQLGVDIAFGTFGENLTIDVLPPDMNTGDRLLIGDVILEVTAPRIPCSTLAARMQDSNFGLAFRRAERPGYYCRVLHEGDIQNGDTVTLAENPVEAISILEQFRLSYETSPDPAVLQRALEAPLAERMRHKFQTRLAACSTSAE